MVYPQEDKSNRGRDIVYPYVGSKRLAKEIPNLFET